MKYQVLDDSHGLQHGQLMFESDSRESANDFYVAYEQIGNNVGLLRRSKTIQVESYGDLLDLAESLGFIEPEEFDTDEWTVRNSDDLEECAIDFLNENGILPIYND